MTIYFSHPSGGPCWSRERGYHTPKPFPFPMIAAREAAKAKPISDEYRCFIGAGIDDIGDLSDGS